MLTLGRECKPLKAIRDEARNLPRRYGALIDIETILLNGLRLGGHASDYRSPDLVTDVTNM